MPTFKKLFTLEKKSMFIILSSNFLKNWSQDRCKTLDLRLKEHCCVLIINRDPVGCLWNRGHQYTCGSLFTVTGKAQVDFYLRIVWLRLISVLDLRTQ